MDLNEKEKQNIKTALQNEEKDVKQKGVMKRWVKAVTIVGIVLAALLFAAVALPVIISFTTNAEQELLDNMDRLGIFGYLALFVMQVLQVVIAIIPGGVVQFAAGFMSDMTWLGILVCLAGVYTGQLIIFRLVRRFGHNLVEAVAGGEKLKRWNFIRNEKKLELLTFILFVIPGLPKDLFCYVFPLSPINEDRFMLISVIARVPAVISSVYAADYFRNGQYIKAAVIWGVILLISMVAIAVVSKLMSKRKGK